MHSTESVTFGPVKNKKERTLALGGLHPGTAFRLQGVSFEDALGGDNVGGCFYYVDGETKEGLVPVVSFDWKVRNMLPEETLIHPHHIEIGIHPCQFV